MCTRCLRTLRGLQRSAYTLAPAHDPRTPAAGARRRLRAGGHDRQHDRRRHPAHAGRDRRAAAGRLARSWPSGSPAASTRCSARSRSRSWARCCRAPAGSTSSRGTGSATTRASSSAGATGSRPAARRRPWRSSSASTRRRCFPAGADGNRSWRGGGRGAVRARSSGAASARGAASERDQPASRRVAFVALIAAASRSAAQRRGRRGRRRRCRGLAARRASSSRCKSVIYTYDGWTASSTSPRRCRIRPDIPRAMFGGVLPIIAHLPARQPRVPRRGPAADDRRERLRGGRGRRGGSSAPAATRSSRAGDPRRC